MFIGWGVGWGVKRDREEVYSNARHSMAYGAHWSDKGRNGVGRGEGLTCK